MHSILGGAQIDIEKKMLRDATVSMIAHYACCSLIFYDYYY